MTTQKEETLPVEIFKQVSNHINSKEINRLSMTCSYFYNFFRKDNYFLSPFLILVSHGEQDLAEQLLKNIDLTLMVKKGTIIDYSKRIFTYNSAFQYILGALDTRYMCTMFLQCLRDDKKYSIQKKKEIAIELKRQYLEFEKEGITYTLDGVTHEKVQHFGFTPLIETLTTYVANYDLWLVDTCKKYFCTKVGAAQIQVPTHVAQHYCDPDVSFSPKPTFTAQTFKRSLVIYNYLNSKCQKWWECIDNLVLGQDFGIYRGSIHGDGYGWGAGEDSLLLTDATTDLEAITTLFETRTKDKRAIAQKLEDLIQDFDLALESQEQASLQMK